MRGFFRNRHRPASERGFTLTELLVTMAIIATLAGVAIPVIASQRDKATRAAAETDLSNAFEELNLAYKEGRLGEPPTVTLEGSQLTFLVYGSNPENFCLQTTYDHNGTPTTIHRTPGGIGDGPCASAITYPPTVFPLGSDKKTVTPTVEGVSPSTWDYEGSLPPGFKFDAATGTITGPASNEWGWEGTSLAAGDGGACVATSTGQALCWGTFSTSDDTKVPADVAPGVLTQVTQVAAGGEHMCALTGSGEVYCWGGNASGQANPTASGGTVTTPTRVDLGGDIAVEVAAGASHTCVLTGQAAVKCWGSREFGQVQGGTSTPTAIADIAGASHVYAGGTLSCALVNSTLKCWGKIGSTTMTTGTPVADGMAIASASIGARHACLIDAGGDVYCFGANDLKQLGPGGGTAETPAATPVQVTGLPGAADAITAGGQHTCAQTSGDLYCWGSNRYGQLANSTTNGQAQAAPSAVPNVAAPNPAAAGRNFTCSVVAGGEVKCWGDNSQGQLGRGEDTGDVVTGPAVPFCPDASYGEPVVDANSPTGYSCVKTVDTRHWVCPDGYTMVGNPEDLTATPRCEKPVYVPPTYYCPLGGTLTSLAPPTCTVGTDYSYPATPVTTTESQPATPTSTSGSTVSYTCPAASPAYTLTTGTPPMCTRVVTTSPNSSCPSDWEVDPANSNKCRKITGWNCDAYGVETNVEVRINLRGWPGTGNNPRCEWWAWYCRDAAWPDKSTDMPSKCLAPSWSPWYHDDKGKTCSDLLAQRRANDQPSDGFDCAWLGDHAKYRVRDAVTGTLELRNFANAAPEYSYMNMSYSSTPCPAGYSLSGGLCRKTETIAATSSSVYSCNSGGTLSGSQCSYPVYSCSTGTLNTATTPPTCNVQYCRASADGSAYEPTPVSVWNCNAGSEFLPTGGQCSYTCVHTPNLSSASTYCSAVNANIGAYCTNGATSASSCTNTASCPSGYYNNGSNMCWSNGTSTTGTACSSLGAGYVDKVWTAATCPSGYTGPSGGVCSRTYAATAGSTSTTVNVAQTCSSIANKAAYCPSGYSFVSNAWVSPNCKITCSKTTYSCPSGGSLSGSLCTQTTSPNPGYCTYRTETSPNWSSTFYCLKPNQTVTGPISALAGSTQSTSATLSYSNQPANGSPVTVTTYSCPAGWTLEGTMCYRTTTTYTCPSGGTLSGTTCTVSTSRTYAASVLPGTGTWTPGAATVDATLEGGSAEVRVPADTTPTEYSSVPNGVSGAGAMQGLPAQITVRMTDTGGNIYDQPLVLSME